MCHLPTPGAVPSHLAGGNYHAGPEPRASFPYPSSFIFYPAFLNSDEIDVRSVYHGPCRMRGSSRRRSCLVEHHTSLGDESSLREQIFYVENAEYTSEW